MAIILLVNGGPRRYRFLSKMFHWLCPGFVWNFAVLSANCARSGQSYP